VKKYYGENKAEKGIGNADREWDASLKLSGER
jgi:hypothetical protein